MWGQGIARRAGVCIYESATSMPAPRRRSSPACLSQLVLWLGLGVMVVQGGALPSIFGGSFSSTSGTDKPGLPPLVWYAPFYSGGGYCSEAIAFMQALQQTAPPDTLLAIQQHGDSYSPSFLQGLDRDTIMMMMELNDAWSRVNVSEAMVVCHSEPGAWHPPKYHTTTCPPSGALYRVGRTMFETDRLPQGWATRLNSMDEVWVPTSFHADIFTQGGVSPSKLVVVGEGVDTHYYSPTSRHPPYPLPKPVPPPPSPLKRPFVFLSVFKWEVRKGYDVLLSSYLSEFGPTDDVTLVLLTNAYHDTSDFDVKVRSLVQSHFPDTDTPGGRQWPQDFARITVLSGLSGVELAGLYKSCDVYVAPSRGEGWGRPHVEAMATAKPVIATNWSGPTEFLSEANGYPLRYDGLEEITQGAFRGHKWAAPSQSHLKELLRHTYTHPEECVAKGLAARATMEQHYSLPVMGRLLVQHLTRIQQKVKHGTQPAQEDTQTVEVEL